ncbi:7-carboxy-7-deazaguanine synthase QueE [Spongiactinospora gelatinilytica]|uniref:7-carboxy-7-deazaguanine synthase n=1 Tax=Spongiactinospora gelatinilytica TaxID=2666298 RepID=A0A2W2H714_9ACTN|nr:7-carboxy-7-deazaguanine synthase QueE [Spongiactinospora gelatinilytica]PZG42027.1 7-carboxy-7-deazaguanine synthase QueE [Spongiactinospora gelatinilytica]
MTGATVEGLVVSEVFGPTVQGEGPSCGRRAAFVRLGGCNLGCSWCDTPYTWDGHRFDLRAELSRMAVADIADQIAEMNVPLVVITGGEPLLQQDYPAFGELLRLLWDVEVEVETNGTRVPSTATAGGVSRFNVGLKLASSGEPESRRIVPQALAFFRRLAGHDGACFKAVCRDEADVAELADLAESHVIDPADVWVMPEGVTAEATTTHLRQIADPAIAAGFNLTPRLHVLAWNDERGR